MRRLILIRHSLPEIVPELPASQWHLSEEGKRRCEALAGRLVVHEPSLIVSSLEPKATETGLLVARILELPHATAGDLHEHERNSVAFCGDEAQFKAQVVRVLEDPQAPVFGDETGSEAQERFAQALASVMERYTGGNIAVVTHGTVLSLFVSRAAGIKAAPLWNRLGMPSFAVLRLPGYGIVEIVESVQEW